MSVGAFVRDRRILALLCRCWSDPPTLDLADHIPNELVESASRGEFKRLVFGKRRQQNPLAARTAMVAVPDVTWTGSGGFLPARVGHCLPAGVVRATSPARCTMGRLGREERTALRAAQTAWAAPLTTPPKYFCRDRQRQSMRRFRAYLYLDTAMIPPRCRVRMRARTSSHQQWGRRRIFVISSVFIKGARSAAIP